MSRRIKPDRRTVADRGTVIEITNVVDYSGIPEELTNTIKQVRDDLWRAGWRLTDEMYRDEWNRDGMAYDLCDLAANLDWVLKELRLIPDDPKSWHYVEYSTTA